MGLSTTSPESTHQRREEQPSLRIYRAHHTPGKHWEGSLHSLIIIDCVIVRRAVSTMPSHYVLSTQGSQNCQVQLFVHMPSNPFFTNQHHHCQYYFIHTRTSFLLYMLRYTFCVYQ